MEVDIIIDYDKALYYTIWGQWDDLFILMVRTKDDFLSQKIKQFLHAFHYSLDEDEIVTNHEQLIHYLEHAMKDEHLETLEM